MLGLALLAALRQRCRTLLGVTPLNGLGALLLIVGALAFLLDAFQVHAGVPLGWKAWRTIARPESEAEVEGPAS